MEIFCRLNISLLITNRCSSFFSLLTSSDVLFKHFKLSVLDKRRCERGKWHRTKIKVRVNLKLLHARWTWFARSVCVCVCWRKWVWLDASRLQMAHSEAKSSDRRYYRSFRYRFKRQKATPVLCIITFFVLLCGISFSKYMSSQWYTSLFLNYYFKLLNQEKLEYLGLSFWSLPLSSSSYLFSTIHQPTPPLIPTSSLIHPSPFHLLTSTFSLPHSITFNHPKSIPIFIPTPSSIHPNTIPHLSQSLPLTDINLLLSTAYHTYLIPSPSLFPDPFHYSSQHLPLSILSPSFMHPNSIPHSSQHLLSFIIFYKQLQPHHLPLSTSSHLFSTIHPNPSLFHSTFSPQHLLSFIPIPSTYWLQPCPTTAHHL